MTPDETTPLLAKSAPDLAYHSRISDGKTTGSARSRKIFALWQIGALFGIMLAYADTSLVWATHETVASRFDHLKKSSWMMTSFTIGYCVTLPLYGRLSDNYGRLHPLIAAYSTFCIGCTLCGIGHVYWQIILGRFTTGCGASGVISLASIIITDIAAPSDVAVLRSYVNIASTLGLSFGGPLGGLLSGTIGWRWSFLGQVPIAIICCMLTARGLQTFLPTSKEHKERNPREANSEMKKVVLGFDFPGAVALALAMSSLLTLIDLQSQLSWRHPFVLSLAISGSTSLVVFLLLEAYPGNREPLIPLRLLKTEVGAFCAGQVLMVGACHGFCSQIAPYFANTQGASDAVASWPTIPASIGNALGNLVAGRIIKRYTPRFGSYKKLSLINLFLSTGSTLLILFVWSHTIGIWPALLPFPYGVFAGIVLSTQFIGLYMCAPKQHMATAISMYYMSQQIGIALGISLCSSLLKQRFQAALNLALASIPDYKELIQEILTDSSAVELLSPDVIDLVRRSYLRSFWVVPALVTSCQVLALVPMVFTSEKRSQ